MRKAREAAGYNQRDFAEHLGVSHQTVTNAEKGHRAVRKITIKAWAMATGVPAQWLDTGVAPDHDDPNGNVEDTPNTRRYPWSPHKDNTRIRRIDFRAPRLASASNAA